MARTFVSAYFMGGGLGPFPGGTVPPQQSQPLLPLTTTGDSPTFAFQLPQEDITGFIQAMQTEGLATILAQPRLLAMSGQNAVFMVGGEIPIRIATGFAKELEALVAELAMERTRFDVRFGDGPLPEPAWSGRGIDACEFFVSPNLGEDLRPLARIVSGGELSRIMLAIKTLTATTRHGFSDAADRPPSASAPGLIFDEVDAGIGGRVADVVGGKLRVLGSAFQVLCITHLPQIAAYADTHFRIEKHIERGRTKTSVTRLDDAGRIEEVSRMLGGTGISEGIRASAREMLAARSGKAKAKGEMKSKGESETRRRVPR